MERSGTEQVGYTQRFFIAAEINTQFKLELLRYCRQWQERKHFDERAIRWSHIDQLHLTLAYLGPQRSSDLQSLIEPLTLQLDRQRCLSLDVEAITSFPARHPKVIAAQLATVTPLNDLYQAVQHAVEDSGLTVPTPPTHFHPHITLGRFRRGHMIELHRALSLCCPISVVTLFHSELTPQRAIHTAVYRFDLTTKVD